MIKLTRPPLRSGWRFLDDSDPPQSTSPASLRSDLQIGITGTLIDFAADRFRRNPQKALRGESKLLSRGTALEMAAPTEEDFLGSLGSF
jgi:hypothetical protein